jgi:hypothetical protein
MIIIRIKDLKVDENLRLRKVVNNELNQIIMMKLSTNRKAVDPL